VLFLLEGGEGETLEYLNRDYREFIFIGCEHLLENSCFNLKEKLFRLFAGGFILEWVE
jgi:hypothetical protein